VPPSLPTFSFHENGNGQLELPVLFGGGVIPLPGTLVSDTGPGGLASALTFTAHPLVNPFPEGDVVVLDAGGRVSDILRFNPATSSSSGLTQLIFFYSNDHGGLLADTGLPSGLYDNTVTIQESQSGPTVYTPTAGQPGFSTDSPLGDSFHIFSALDTGSTFLMLGAHCRARVPPLENVSGVTFDKQYSVERSDYREKFDADWVTRILPYLFTTHVEKT
jgi:hypothetical protein